jgi:hypothetical protein
MNNTAHIMFAADPSPLIPALLRRAFSVMPPVCPSGGPLQFTSSLDGKNYTVYRILPSEFFEKIDMLFEPIATRGASITHVIHSQDGSKTNVPAREIILTPWITLIVADSEELTEKWATAADPKVNAFVAKPLELQFRLAVTIDVTDDHSDIVVRYGYAGLVRETLPKQLSSKDADVIDAALR